MGKNPSKDKGKGETFFGKYPSGGEKLRTTNMVGDPALGSRGFSPEKQSS